MLVADPAHRVTLDELLHNSWVGRGYDHTQATVHHAHQAIGEQLQNGVTSVDDQAGPGESGSIWSIALPTSWS